MEQLDERKNYDLSKLNDKQIIKAYNWLQKNDISWLDITFERFKKGLDGWVLHFSGKWYFIREKSITVCATELFEPKNETMKGFIEVTEKAYLERILLVHYTQIVFVGEDREPCLNDRFLKETYEEIKELIKQAT